MGRLIAFAGRVLRIDRRTAFRKDIVRSPRGRFFVRTPVYHGGIAAGPLRLPLPRKRHATRVGSRNVNLGKSCRFFVIFRRLAADFLCNMRWCTSTERPNAQRPWVPIEAAGPKALLLAACLLAVGLTGCCSHQPCDCRRPRCGHATAAERDEAFPPAPEYPRFHPVPTRPVFLPDGVEPILAAAGASADARSVALFCSKRRLASAPQGRRPRCVRQAGQAVPVAIMPVKRVVPHIRSSKGVMALSRMCACRGRRPVGRGAY